MLSLEILMAAALSRGLSLRDFDEMTIGMILDYVHFYDEARGATSESGPKEATQADIDAFYGR